MDREILLSLAVILIVVASLPVCYLWPWTGAVLWGWLAFVYPHRLAGGNAFGVHLAWLAALATLAGVAVNGTLHRLPRSREMYLFLGLWAFCALTTAVAAIFPQLAWVWFLDLTRIFCVTLVVMSLSQERGKFEALIWATALALGVYAANGAVWVLYTGGVDPLYGPRASNIENNNDLGATLIGIAPFFVFLGRRAGSPWARGAAVALFGATIVAILGTYSRGAALALGLVVVLLAVVREWRALAVVAAAFAVFMLFTTPAKWLNRVDTIRTYQQDASTAMRPKEWYVAIRLGLDHPLLGAGFRPFSPAAYERYVPGYSDHRDAHNMLLQVFAEHGFPGLALYVALIVSTFATLWRTSRRPISAEGDAWLQDFARILPIGIAGYLLDGMFQCLSYRAFFIELLAFSMMVDALARAPGHVIAPATLPRWLASGSLLPRLRGGAESRSR